MKRLATLCAILLVLAMAVTGWWWYSEHQAAEARLLRASGMLEATSVAISSELGGRLATRPVREGDEVRRGGMLAELDVELLEHQIVTAPDLATRLHLERQRDRQTLRSPLDGWVAQTLYEPGEQVAPGAPVVVVADWRELTLKVYLPEDRFGRVALGQRADVAVDAYPGEVFAGQVTFIGSEAEFTPRNVQTREDRVKSVYPIKLRVPNADLRLKPGMFADAVFTNGPTGYHPAQRPGIGDVFVLPAGTLWGLLAEELSGSAWSSLSMFRLPPATCGATRPCYT